MPAPLVDIVNRDNQPLGLSVEPEHAARYGQWFRGVHVLVYTRDGYVLVERRASRLLFRPNDLDLSLGGLVDAGETPEAAAIRELYEEVGLIVQPEQLKLVSVARYNRRWPRLHKTARNIMYHYLVELPNRDVPMQLERHEVAAAEFIPVRDAWHLVHQHTLRRLGRISGRYRMYDHLLSRLPPSV